MRKLFFLSGCPASGKNTFLTTNNLTSHSLGFDDIRSLMSGPHQTTHGVSISVSQKIEPLVKQITVDMLTARLQNSETVFLNNTNCTDESITQWLPLLNEYNYDYSVINIQGDRESLQSILNSNANRPSIDTVPDEKIRFFYQQQQKFLENTKYPVITPAEAITQLDYHIPDYSNYSRILVVGDIHSSGSILKETIQKFNPSTHDLIIFCGDLFDRGIEPELTWDTLQHITAHHHTVFLEGNHELNMRGLLIGKPVSVHKGTQRTLDRLHDHRVTRKEILDFLNTFQPFTVFTYGNHIVWVTHGGLASTPPVIADTIPRFNLWSGRDTIYGTCSRTSVYKSMGDYVLDVDSEFTANTPNNYLQFHGHRHLTISDTIEGRSVNLDSMVEFPGGKLSTATLTNNGTVTLNRAVNRFASTQDSKQKPVKILHQDLLNSSSVKHAPVHGHPDLTVYNISQKGFRTCPWGVTERSARGLILDSEGRVVQKGYHKSFSIGERPETELINLKDTLAFPCTVEEKKNGYLALVTAYNGKLLVTTKNGVTDYSQYFENLLTLYLGDQLESFTCTIEKRNVTLTFEVITELDPHIVDVTVEPAPVLLHALAKTGDKQLLLYPVADIFRGEYGFTAPASFTIHNWSELEALLRRLEDPADSINTTEGVMIIDRNQYMVKAKTGHYLAWKRIRSYAGRLANGHTVNMLQRETPYVQQVVSQLQCMPEGQLRNQFFTSTIGGNTTLNIPLVREYILTGKVA